MTFSISSTISPGELKPFFGRGPQHRALHFDFMAAGESDSLNGDLLCRRPAQGGGLVYGCFGSM